MHRPLLRSLAPAALALGCAAVPSGPYATEPSGPIIADSAFPEPPAAAAAGGPAQASPETERAKAPGTRLFRVEAGYTSYSMSAFNAKLRAEGNETIDGGFMAAAELSPCTITVPQAVPLLGGVAAVVPVAGVEVLDARSETVHRDAMGTATVTWELPVVGVTLCPEIRLESCPWLMLRPVGVGYYTLGDLFDAELSITDRAGSLEIRDESIGLTSRIGLRVTTGSFALFINAGYRYLEFSGVQTRPTGGFSSENGHLEESLDYSGFSITGGVSVRF